MPPSAVGELQLAPTNFSNTHERGVSEMEGLRMFLGSKTHTLLLDDDLRLWHFSPLALFDMWENELATGDPTNSLYLRGDEIG